jgi:hypothetical protein
VVLRQVPEAQDHHRPVLRNEAGRSAGTTALWRPEDYDRHARLTVLTPARDGSEAALPTRADPALVKALARAFRYQRLLDEGRYSSISEMATAERIERGYLGSLLRMTLLAPDIVKAILDGRQPERLGLPRLLEPFPIGWNDQRNVAISRRVP